MKPMRKNKSFPILALKSRGVKRRRRVETLIVTAQRSDLENNDQVSRSKGATTVVVMPCHDVILAPGENYNPIS